jgi:hypothetical protein
MWITVRLRRLPVYIRAPYIRVPLHLVKHFEQAKTCRCQFVPKRRMRPAPNSDAASV